MKVHYLLYCLFLFSGISCDSQEPVSNVVLPANLQVSLESSPGSGLVTVTATADNANYFNVYFNEGSSTSPIKSTDGKATYTYRTAGSYIIKVTAHATTSDFVEKEISVTISLGSTGGTLVIPTTGYTAPTSYAGMSLVWEDDFSGNTLSTSNWTAEIGRGTNGWGNNELQYYREENTSMVEGNLVITAKKESFSNAEYTSSRLVTRNKKSFQYGRVDIRAVLPKGQGIWPAFWMLGDTFSTVGWPKCGELDIMEMVGGGGRDKTVHGTLHWDNANSYACTCGDAGYSLSNGIFADEFHVFSIVWNANTITWYVDNTFYRTIDISPAEMSEFRASFFFIFNLAVGGNWPGSPDANTTFPQYLIVDYIRVFQ